MSKRERVFLLLTVCIFTLCLSGCDGSESEGYLQLLQEQGITDNSQNHWQNSKSECVQISSNGIFMNELDGKHDKALYELENGEYKKIAEQAYAFFEFEGKVYYYDGKNNIYCYDIETQSTAMFLSVSMSISWFGLYDNNILCAGISGTLDKVLKLYTLDGECIKTYFTERKRRGSFGQVVRIGRFVVFLENLEAEVYDLENDKSHYLIWEDGLSNSYMVSDQENLYMSAGRYVIEGDYSISEVDSKWNGLWKISLQDMQKNKWDLTKISDQSYSKFYCVENKLFDEDFTSIK